MDTNDDASETQPRSIKTAPFAWQHKGALRMIRDNCEDGNGHSAFALAIYLALTELASDAQSATFTAPISKIAQRAGASYRTTAKTLNRLESLKLVSVERGTVSGTKERAPSTYTMLGTPCLTLGKQNANCLPRIVKNQKNKEETPLTEGTHHPAPRAADADSSFSNYVGEEKEQIQLYHQKFSDTDEQWLPVLKYSERVREALELLPDLATAKLFFDAVSVLVSKGEDYGSFTWKPTGETFECYLPAPNKRTGKRTLVRLLQCNRDEIATIADITATYEPLPDPRGDIPI